MKQYNIETELIANEIGYLKPVRPSWRTYAEDIAGALLIVGFAAFLIWFTSL